jgi:hypothetical protein
LEIAFLGGPTGGSDIPAESTLMARIFDAIVHTYHVPHEVPFREVTLYTEPKSLDTIQNIKFFLHRIYPQIQEKYPGREKENFTWIGISCGFHIPRLKRIAAYNHLQFDYLVKSPVHPSTVKLKIPKRTKIFYLFEHLREGMLLAILPWILRYSNRLGPEDKALKMFRGSGITARISSFLRFFTHK